MQRLQPAVVASSTGTGSLEQSRGTDHLTRDGVDAQRRAGHLRAAIRLGRHGGARGGAATAGRAAPGTAAPGPGAAGPATRGPATRGPATRGRATAGPATRWSGNCWSGNSWSGNSWSGNSWSGNSWSRQLLVGRLLVDRRLGLTRAADRRRRPTLRRCATATDDRPVRPFRLGLTGPIGCGKSTVAGWLGERAGRGRHRRRPGRPRRGRTR